jgi:hypothetical protein
MSQGRPEDDLSRFCCLNPACPDYGKRGAGNLTVPMRYGQAVVVFRGSTDYLDWAVNLSGEMVEGYGGKVHHGFASRFDIIWPGVYKAIRALKENC